MQLGASTNKFVIANPETCIGCATCMAACYESAYERGKLATPRLVVSRVDGGTMPNQCRQCDDAPCANVCPVGALRFGKNNYIEVYEDLCIGCKMCTIACPFGAIRAEAEKMPSVNYNMEPNYNLATESEIGAKSIAVKCDLCNGREDGPACVAVCPTGALMFIDSQATIEAKAKNTVASFVETTKRHHV
ncbi:4Fe-4S dicluster domain-containing protein [Sulfurospirillum sp. 1612]|uniref:4Fe-4S dicluster domain-containing protein n=1 Tax=Sulfurospirillum sp. 1612 TaxID=3094835 RepID=UPI002F95A9A8